ncbi:hypothetical protein SKAU_G00375750 [Synaphobranchus kaupii]|uniref:Uncharacterized protein n=1 Tax=Synaphobranchus kaupii TaxID=118154 RepID=A0A9Q1ECN8_SYNKA|nr:hypothetical protein SKAU_G00375750 [Synaphobranchus kaupii]
MAMQEGLLTPLPQYGWKIRGRRLYVSCGSKHTCMWSVNRPCHAGVYSDRSADWLTCGTFTPGPVGNQSTKPVCSTHNPDQLHWGTDHRCHTSRLKGTPAALRP